VDEYLPALELVQEARALFSEELAGLTCVRRVGQVLYCTVRPVDATGAAGTYT